MKVKKIAATLCALSMLACSVFSGCGSKDTSAGDGSSAAENQSKESETADAVMKIGSPQSSQTLDPVNGYDYWYAVRFGVGETLMGFNEDMTPYGWLAEDEIELSADNLTWTITIKDGINFSNGNPVNADAVKACFERAFAETTVASTYIPLDKMEADGQKLSITTTVPVPTMKYLLADPLFVVYDVSVDLTNIADAGPIGTGPFVFSSFDSTTGNTSVVRNEDYWDGEVKLAGIDFSIIKDTTSLAMSLTNGEIDAAYSVSTEDIEKFSGNSDYIIETSPSGRTTFGFMNQKGVLGDEILRQALLRMIDRATYCSILLKDQFIPGKTPLTSSLPYGYDELNDINAYDPESAVKLLDDAGYKDIDGDGFREMPDGSPLSIPIITYSARAEIPELAAAVQNDCAKYGLKIEINQLEQSAAWNALTSGEYDICMMSVSFASSGDPAGSLRSYFHTYDADNPNYNASGYSNTEVDALLDELDGTFDIDKRIELIKQIEQNLMDDTACIYFCYPIMNFVTKANVSGITSHTSDYYWVSKDTCIK